MSLIFILSDRAYDTSYQGLIVNLDVPFTVFEIIMASFPLKNAYFSYLPLFNSEFKNVSLALDRFNIACLGLCYSANYSCKKFFPMTYHLATIHSLQHREL